MYILTYDSSVGFLTPHSLPSLKCKFPGHRLEDGGACGNISNNNCLSSCFLEHRRFVSPTWSSNSNHVINVFYLDQTITINDYPLSKLGL